jgi:hypothetical protein
MTLELTFDLSTSATKSVYRLGLTQNAAQYVQQPRSASRHWARIGLHLSRSAASPHKELGSDEQKLRFREQ